MTWEVRQGDCREAMATFHVSSVDAIVTDPPYGLAFMGKAWDHGVPGVPFWTDALRVAKPGAHLVAFGGTRTYHRLTCAIEDAGWEIRDCLMWLYGQGFPKGKAQLKPAWEPIVLARKAGPLWLNVDGCRVEGAVTSNPLVRNAGGYSGGLANQGPTGAGRESVGRWPANVLLDEDAAAMLDEQSGTLTSGRLEPHHKKPGHSRIGTFEMRERTGEPGSFGGDTGGASRFFYTAKASSGERHYAGKNSHPTVKPVDLMRWLCRLVTPPGGLIVDPFMGSGSTGVAAMSEGFRFLGIEQDAQWCDVARSRIAGPLFAEAAP